MDISRIQKSSVQRTGRPETQKTEAGVTFQEIMKQGRQNNAQYERLGQLLHQIEDQGKVLSESRTVEELRKYKQLVKEFMDDAVKTGLNLEENRGFNRRGRTKVYKIVKEVDSRLVDLTDAVVRTQKKGLDILKMTGEIQGLLVNLYA
ncbi:YaaR family protein [Alkalicoccus urumqiensis]|uniref:DUF327 domain-containing protein n=1 Tax=Alkalicoccus urumqiensis TaxID=1548213 RepID=A0A2P6MKF4_ALKUR|nr:YaaR family protein [Alkalicoccus urumqiensis]PRO66741.1 DUF327 domain-containing protein [Alkalicoccus urumqiensis]